MAVSKLNLHDQHVRQGVRPAVEVVQHGRLISPLTRDVKLVAIHPQVKWLIHFAHIQEAIPPACNQVNYV